MTTPHRQNMNSPWYQFDPNVHFYYDEHGQIHYYDPNTNLECHYQPQYTPYTQPISRQATPDVLLPCPEPNCTGENKPKSKFCEECGRPLVISRSVTPSVTRTARTDIVRPATAPVYLSQTAVDPLGRSKGCPLVTFGFGGQMLVSFPKRIPDYYNSTITCRPGPIQVKKLKDYIPLTSLQSPALFDSAVGVKQKKKDLATFITQKIQLFEEEKKGLASTEYHRMESKIILWKLIQTYLETDGHIDDKDQMDQALLKILRLPITVEDDSNFSLPSQTAQEEPTDLSDLLLSKIERFLHNGDRVGAVNYAIQEDLWAHALIISSCVGKELWQQVITGFVGREMNATPEMRQTRTPHNIAGTNQPLRVLYSLFSGLGSAAMKEFIIHDNHYVNVPYGTASTKPSADIDQLAKWRNTVAIILANRTARDSDALATLGDILKDQGWIEAAHICYFLSPQTSIHSGLDTMNVRWTLLGSSRCSAEAINLTEIYELGYQLKHTNCLPFLQSYKLSYAWILSDYGYLDEAQRYHDAIDQAIRSSTKESPYFNQSLINQLSAFQLHLENATGKKTR
ncbi:Sec23-binding domain of Sec16-domain-containing protein [Sporodiniella umbellata]|nr:Sec23-binding domain of Sec16-domain-containing protein [Sporodiniella umbellata]